MATSADLAGDQTVISRAEAVRPAVGAASNEIESTRRLPPDLLDKLHEARLFRLLLPRSSDGIETDPVTLPPRATISAAASSRVRRSSVPVSTKL